MERRTDHDLLDAVVLALCAVMSGAEGWDDIEVRERARESWLRRYLGLRNGISGHDTIRLVFEAISPHELETRFEQWKGVLCPVVAGRVIAIDGKALRGSGRSGRGLRASRGETAFPQMRFVALAECGTHVLLNAVPGSYRDSELKLAQSVIPHVDPTMLLMADRNFFGYAFWKSCLATGVKFLFRVKANLRLPREQELSDGSYLSTIYPNDKDRRKHQNGIVVRVVEYALDGINHAEPVYRLVTNWLVPEAAPAVEPAAPYHRRWKIETSFDEAKVHLLDGSTTLRSKTPDLVLQEFYALMITHAAIRRMMVEAAGSTGQAAEDLSYVHAIRVLKRRISAAVAIPS